MGNPKIGIIGLKGLPAFGGSARAGETMIGLLKKNYDFTVYNTSSHTEKKSGFYEGYELIVFRKFFIIQLNTIVYYIKAALNCLFFRKYDIIHVFHMDAAFVIPILRLKYKVIAGHRARPQEFSKWNKVIKLYFNFMEYIFYKFPADYIVSVSKPIIDNIPYKTKKEVIYIPNGIDLRNINIKLEVIKYKDYLLFASGRVIETKGCHFMLEALKRINYKGLIIVIGNLEHSLKYREKLLAYKQHLNILFTNLIKNKSQLMAYFKNAKIAIYPSLHEGMSNTLLEIASMKTPLICSDIPENTIVFNENEALHFKSQDSEDLAKKIIWAFDNMEIMNNKAEMAYKKIETVYNWNILASEYDKLYKSLL